MSLKQNCKAVLKAMSFNRLVILCYDYFPAVYAELPPQANEKVVRALLLAEVDSHDLWVKLARAVGVVKDKKKKDKPPTINQKATGKYVAQSGTGDAMITIKE